MNSTDHVQPTAPADELTRRAEWRFVVLLLVVLVVIGAIGAGWALWPHHQSVKTRLEYRYGRVLINPPKKVLAQVDPLAFQLDLLKADAGCDQVVLADDAAKCFAGYMAQYTADSAPQLANWYRVHAGIAPLGPELPPPYNVPNHPESVLAPAQPGGGSHLSFIWLDVFGTMRTQNMGLSSFDVGTFTDYFADRRQALPSKLSINAKSFVAQVKNAFSAPTLAPALA